MDVERPVATVSSSARGDLSPLRTVAAYLGRDVLLPRRSAIFLDRDGVIVKNVTREDGTVGSPRTLAEFQLVKSVATLTRRAHEAGYALVVVTNQPDIARGELNPLTLESMNEILLRSIPHLDAIYTCPHDDTDGCVCRKPRPGLIKFAADELRLQISDSWLIGDRSSDIEAGSVARIRPICVPSQIKGRKATRMCKATIQHIHASSIAEAFEIATGLSEPSQV